MHRLPRRGAFPPGILLLLCTAALAVLPATAGHATAPEDPQSIGRMAVENKLAPQVWHWVEPQMPTHKYGFLHDRVLGEDYFAGNPPVDSWYGHMTDRLPRKKGDAKHIWPQSVHINHTPHEAEVPQALYAAAGLNERAPGLYYFKVPAGPDVRELALRDVPFLKQYLRITIRKDGTAKAELMRASVEHYEVNTFFPSGKIRTTTMYRKERHGEAHRPGYLVKRYEYAFTGWRALFSHTSLKSFEERRVEDPSDPWWPDILQE